NPIIHHARTYVTTIGRETYGGCASNFRSRHLLLTGCAVSFFRQRQSMTFVSVANLIGVPSPSARSRSLGEFALLPLVDEVRVLFQTVGNGLLVVVAAVVLIGEHEVLEAGQMVIVEDEVLQKLRDVGVLLGSFLTREAEDALGIAHGTLRVLEVANREGVIGPVRTPQGHCDVLSGVCRLLQLCEHRRSRGD